MFLVRFSWASSAAFASKTSGAPILILYKFGCSEELTRETWPELLALEVGTKNDPPGDLGGEAGGVFRKEPLGDLGGDFGDKVFSVTRAAMGNFSTTLSEPTILKTRY
jgi:hypothetical protein